MGLIFCLLLSNLQYKGDDGTAQVQRFQRVGGGCDAGTETLACSFPNRVSEALSGG